MSVFDRTVDKLETSDMELLLADSAVENVRLEFKREIPSKNEVLKKLSSFANTYGGYLIVGLEADSSDGRLVALPGVEPSSNLKQQLVQWCYDGVWPPLEIFVSDPLPSAQDSSRCFYVVYVPESLEAPHFLNGRRGAYVRTDEFSQRFEARLATYDEIEHLRNRRKLLVNRRNSLLARAHERFATLVDREYESTPATTGEIGATLYLSLCPLFPAHRLIDHPGLLDVVSATKINWRQSSFPGSGDPFTQHESVLVQNPAYRFGLMDTSVWGSLFYASEMEELLSNKMQGIHLYGLLGYVLVFLEHARVLYGKLGYHGPLRITMGFHRIQGSAFLYDGGGGSLVQGPSSPLDDVFTLDTDVSTERLSDERDSVARGLITSIFFALNWPDMARDEPAVKKLIQKGYSYNSWKETET